MPIAPRSSGNETGSPTAEFVGSATCAECHADEHEHHRRTPHGNSFAVVDPAQEPGDGRVLHGATGFSYEIYRDGGSVRHRESFETLASIEQTLADYPVTYVVGSGQSARTYLIKDDGFLAESPVTWYASGDAWGMSPGYEHDNSGFGRAVYRNCLDCHCGRLEVDGQSERSIQFAELAIGCENCHGPGGEHVRAHRGESVPPSDKPTIVNPRHLSREQIDSICGQCHLHGEVQVVRRNRHFRPFRPGEMLSDSRVEFRHLLANDDMTVTGHAEQLFVSACYQNSDTLSCITCHNPHRRATAENRASLMRSHCLACHTSEACTESAAVRHATAHIVDDCVMCHMPSTTTDVPHVAATHHRIGIHSSTASSRAASAAPERLVELTEVAWESEADRLRAFGLAYLALSRRQAEHEASEGFRQLAAHHLQSAYNSGIDDSDVLCGLALTALPIAPGRALELADTALGSTGMDSPTRIDALWVKSQVLVGQERLEEAIPVLRELTTLRRQGADWFQLAACLHTLGRHDEAIAAAERAVAIRPELAICHELLAAVYSRVERQRDADAHRILARELADRLGAAPN